MADLFSNYPITTMVVTIFLVTIIDIILDKVNK